MKRALVSVSDKTNLVPFVQGLAENGFEIVSTGGTKQVLDEAGIKTISIEDVTHFPEILDGRVKTLNPYVHGGLLARREVPEHMATLKEHQITPIDLVCVNLYPFKQTIEKEGVSLAEAIENIDIGGPSMVRSAAKNYRDILKANLAQRYVANSGFNSSILDESQSLDVGSGPMKDIGDQLKIAKTENSMKINELRQKKENSGK